MRLAPSVLPLALLACGPGSVGIDDTDPASTDDTDPADDVQDSSADDTGTLPDTAVDTDDSAAPSAPPTLADLAAEGPFAVQTGTGQQAIQADCSTNIPLQTAKRVTFFSAQPQGGRASTAVVVLAHGFARSKANMNGWARHLASHGYETLSTDLCTNLFSIDHEKNGRALAQFANTRYRNRDVVFVGYSAGGLAAVLAAENADNVIGVFGLDMVDSNGTGGGPIPPTSDPNFGVLAAPDLDVPFWGIKGEPSSCNSEGNGQAVYDAASDGTVLKLVDAGHCDFERPRASSCPILCPDPDPSAFTDAEQQDVLAAMLVSFVQEVTGTGNQPEVFWTEGETAYDDLTADDGALVP